MSQVNELELYCFICQSTQHAAPFSDERDDWICNTCGQHYCGDEAQLTAKQMDALQKLYAEDPTSAMRGQE